MLGKIRRTMETLISVYSGWRLILALGAFSTVVVFSLTLTSNQLVAGISLSLLLLLVLALHGLDVKRQDRLRADQTPVVATIATGETARTHDLPDTWEPIVSVIVTTHNEDQLLLDALTSVANQDWSDFECVIVDDLSTNNTLVNAYETFSDDDRFRFVFNQRNLGLAASRNVGLHLAKGKWVAFLDADDLLYPSAISDRVQTLAKHQGDPFVVGSYCGWHSVDEDTEYAEMEAPPKPPLRSDVTWFDATYDAPFIASAPMIETEAARAIGGFDESLVTAEDFDFWSRLLRQGFVILWSGSMGVAYRQRRNSMYRVTARDHAAITTSVYRANQDVLGSEAPEVGPFLFREPSHVYQTQLATAKRLLVAYVAAVAAEDESSSEVIWEELSSAVSPWMKWPLGDAETISRTARRVESFQSEGAKARAALLDHRVRPRVYTLTRPQGRVTRPEISSRLPETPHSLELSDSGLSPWHSRPGEAPAVVLMPSAAYHCDELGPLGIQLQRRGIPVVFAVIPKRVAYVEAELRKYPIAAYIIEQDDQTPRKVAEASSAIVTMNDWGDYDKFVIAGNEAGVPTYGKVEGVQDFTDADVHWERRAYQQVAHVLCQGENDYQATSGPRTVVGSTRLERIWKAPPVAERDRSVVINLNFTYGVLEDARDLWLGTVIEACDRIGIAWTISMHPAQSRPSGVTNISIEPMRHLLTKPSILVSRFSTVPFEAMARGNPFVYHNPHGEKVPTFHNPMGAFDISTSASQLAEALEKARKESDYRSRCRDFFLRQVDVDQERSSEERTAEVVAASIDSNVSS